MFDFLKSIVPSATTDANGYEDKFLEDCLNVGGSGTENAIVRLGPGVMGGAGGGAAYSAPRSSCEDRLHAIRQLEADQGFTASDAAYGRSQDERPRR